MHAQLALLTVLASRVGTITFPRSHDSFILDSNDVETRSITSGEPNFVLENSSSTSTPIFTDDYSVSSSDHVPLEPRAEEQEQGKHGLGGGSKKQGQSKSKQGDQHPQTGHRPRVQQKVKPNNQITPVDPSKSHAQSSHKSKPNNRITPIPSPKSHPQSSHKSCGKDCLRPTTSTSTTRTHASGHSRGKNSLFNLPHASSPRWVGSGYNPFVGHDPQSHKTHQTGHASQSHPTSKGNPTPKFIRKHPPHPITSLPKITTHKVPPGAGLSAVPVVKPTPSHVSHSHFPGINNPLMHPRRPLLNKSKIKQKYGSTVNYHLTPYHSTKDRGQG